MKQRMDPDGARLPIKPYWIGAEAVKQRAHGDTVALERRAYLAHPGLQYLTYGPRTRRASLNPLVRNTRSHA